MMSGNSSGGNGYPNSLSRTNNQLETMRHLVYIETCASPLEAQDRSIEYSLKGIPNIIVQGSKLYLNQQMYSDRSMSFWTAEETENYIPVGVTTLDDPKTILADTPEKLEAICAIAQTQTLITVDTETTGLNPWLDGLVGISLAWGIGKGQSAYIPIGHWVGENVPLKIVIEYLNPILSDSTIKKAFHNAKFDIKVLFLNGFEVQGLYFDTMVVHWLLYCYEGSRHGLKEVVNKYVNKVVEVPEFKDLMKEVPKGTKHKNIGDLPPARVAYYAGLDAVNTYHCFVGLARHLLSEERIAALWFDVELPALLILVQMELQGLELDSDWYHNQTLELSAEVATIKESAKIYNPNLNIGSVQQLNEFFFHVLKIPTKGIPKNKTGYCLNREVLGYLESHHPLANLVIHYRHTLKMLSTYVRAPMLKRNKVTGKLHTEYKQIGTVTGRLSSTNPNSQNFPVKYRKGIIASPGHILFAADYSGCEYRILSSLSKCKFLIEGYLNGYDAHTTVARMIFPDKDPKEINPAWGKDYRFVGKQINFAIVYGKQPQNLATWIGIPLSTVYEYYDIYWEKLNEVKQLMDTVHKTAVTFGYSETVLGRKRRYAFTDSFYTQQFGLPIEYINLKKDNHPLDAEIFRQCFNAVIQGSNADITKLAMRDCTALLNRLGSNARLLLQIHDELVFEIPFEEIEYLVKPLVKTMESVYPFEVPLKVDYRLGYNWMAVKG